MGRLKSEWPTMVQHGAFNTFLPTIVFLLLTQTCAGQPVVVAPSLPIVAMVGEDTMLPCYLEPAVDATGLTVEWRRPDLTPRFVYVWRDGVELETKKHPSFVGRSSVSTSKLKHGDISLKLQRVKLSDGGRYGCFVPTPNREATVELVVGAVSSLTISFRNSEPAGMVLQCESKGWYPEPRVFWLDGAGNLLSAGTGETFRGPDGLFNVSSRLTVEKRHGNSFTCRVHQADINQTRETGIHVPDHFLDAQCSSSTPVILTLVAAITGFAVVFIACCCKRKQMSYFKQSGTNTDSYKKKCLLLNEEKTGTLQDVERSSKINELDEKKAELGAKFSKKQRKYEDVVQTVNLLMVYKKDLEDQSHHLHEELSDIEKYKGDNEVLRLSLKGVIKHGVDTVRKHFEENKPVTDPKTAKMELEKKLQDTQSILKSISDEVTKLTEKKTCLELQKENINKQLEEIEKTKNEMNHNTSQTI